MILYRASFYFLEPPCSKKVKENNAMFGNSPPKDFVNPTCDKDGYFQFQQCFPLEGCHCVDKYGIPTDCEKSGFLSSYRRSII